MLSFPNAKINIGLNIVSKRTDGYHNLESIFYPIPLCDALEIVESEKFEFSTSGLQIDSTSDNNLCVKAFNLLKSQYNVPNVKIHLHKNIPMGAGLGGGSADASFVLLMLNDLFSLNIKKTELAKLALQLGSDCPFFIYNKAMFASGRGEIFENINLSLAGKFIKLEYPPIHVSTKEAYSGVKPQSSDYDLRQLSVDNIADWQKYVRNDFEKNVLQNHIEIKSLKEKMLSEGAIFSLMSGSGSTVFGIFDQKPNAESRNDNFVFIGELK